MKVVDFCFDYYNKHREGILYLIIGFITTVIYLGVYKLLLDLNFNYLVSTNIAFVIALIFAFFTNKHIVFKKGNNLIREFVLFSAARVVTQIINNAGLAFFIEVAHMGKFVSQLILCVIVTILNYILSKYAIFAEPKGLE